MNKSTIRKLIAVAALLAAVRVHAGQYSAVVGYNIITVQTNSDAVASVPFNQTPVFQGTVDSTSGGDTINVTGLPGGSYGTGQFFVRFTSGAKNGLWSTVASNTGGSLTLADVTVVGGGVVAGDSFELLPHQTLNSVFPASLQGISFIQSAGATAPFRKTEVLELKRTEIGINKSALNTYYYISTGTPGWRLSGGSATTDVGNTVLLPDTYMILRNRNNPTTTLSYRSMGRVEFGTLGRSIQTQSVKNDLYASSGRPVPMTLNQLNLGNTPAFQSSAGATAPFRKDEIYVFDNNKVGLNKSSLATYYYISTGTPGWRLSGGSATTDVGDLPVIDSSAGFILRKAIGTPGTADWQEPAPFGGQGSN